MINRNRLKIGKRERQKKFLIGICDIVLIAISFFSALWFRFDFSFSRIPQEYLNGYLSMILIWCVISIVVFIICNLYNSIWTYAGTDEVFRILAAHIILLAIGVVYVRIRSIVMPRSFYVLGFVFSIVSTTVLRFAYRLYRGISRQMRTKVANDQSKNIMIIGAGEAGRVLVVEYASRKGIKDRIVCAIDDNPGKRYKRLYGIPIVGNRDDIPDAVRRYHVDEIIFAIPSCAPAERKSILNICSTTGCRVKTLPSIMQLINGDVSVNKLRQVNAQDLLGRDPISVNLPEIYCYISGKVVLVTGGGGSIGSELCRQIARAKPKTLIIFDIYENNAYEIQMELASKYPDLDLKVLIGSVRDSKRIGFVMETYRPELVFHAAAHKHVPLMEDSPNESIKNNVFGTHKTAVAAARYGVKRFVLISTDKAVNPTNIMGASKRLCEMIVQMMNRESETEFVAVRFGNVLGSNGSVIPLFKKQIENGGPVTVTHPDIIRYFMTIPEAVSLVLQAGYAANGGEIFVLDMGAPVKIDTMARNLIRLTGLEPDVDIMIEYTGLRPGEKLYEELLMAEEGLEATENKLIHIGKPISMDDEMFKEQLVRLEDACQEEEMDVRQIVAEIVPTYKMGGK